MLSNILSVHYVFLIPLCYVFVLLFDCFFNHCAGWVVSTLLAGATIGSFTGGSLADHFGRTKTFILDAIPLTVGAFLWLDILNRAHLILLCL